MSTRFLAGFGVGLMLLPAAAVAQGNSDDAVRNWAAITECADISDADGRYRCVDDVLNRAGILDQSRVTQTARESFGKDTRSPAPQRQARAATPPAAAPVRADDIDELSTTIRSVKEVGYKMLLVTTAEGSVWEQTHAKTFQTMPKAGDAFTIARGAISGYRCRFGKASFYRCQRVD